MSKIVLRKTPDEFVNYEFEDLVELDNNTIIIHGNRDFISLGDETLISVLKGDYYDDDTGYDYDPLEQLTKLTGKLWTRTTIRGTCQSDWQYVYYVLEEVTIDELNTIEAFYMGEVTEFSVEEDGEYSYTVHVPWYVPYGKEAICTYLGFDPDITTILVDDGYTRVYKYTEVA